MTTIDTLNDDMVAAAKAGDWDRYHAIMYGDAMLQADVAEGRYGVHTHPAQARELLRLDTVERRRRAAAEAHTLGNLMGGVPSGNFHNAVNDLLRRIERGEESQELYGERTAREYREREAELRKVTPGAIYYPNRSNR